MVIIFASGSADATWRMGRARSDPKGFKKIGAFPPATSMGLVYKLQKGSIRIRLPGPEACFASLYEGSRGQVIL
jgi:hypothetical protein